MTDAPSAAAGGPRRGRGPRAAKGAVAGPDGRLRCPWGLSAPDYVAYHDTEWGRPVRGDQPIFERLCLEAFQSGLSWLTILRKRENFRAAFAGFDIEAVAAFGDDDVARLLADAGIVRNRAKINAAINNARAALELKEGLSDLFWSYADPASAPAPVTLADVPPQTPSVETAGQGAARQRLRLHRPGHRLRRDAGLRPGQRPSGGLFRPRHQY